ncbi:MAG: trehalose-6-phosphate synthase [Gemmatimonadaceae bacterium]
MKLSLRFIIPLLAVLAALAAAVLPLADRLTQQWFAKDLELRATLIARTIDEPLQRLAFEGDSVAMRNYFARITQDERLFAIAYCGVDAPIIGTPRLPEGVRCDVLDRYSGEKGHVIQTARGPLLATVRPVNVAGVPVGSLVLVHDMSFAQRRSAETRQYLFYFFVGLGVVVSLITVIVAQLSWRGWMGGMRALLRGEGLLRPAPATSSPVHRGDLQPIADDLRMLIHDLEGERRLRDEEQTAWTPDTLREILERELRGHDVIVVSNREPYIHVREGDAIVVQRPASGLVTAVEPIMRACSGTWIAHGSGSADRDVVDAHDRVAAPVEEPGYQIRRLWLTPEEEQGYYYGFANEGLWPLCHIAHVRPSFSSGDWTEYERVNQKFADAVVQEAKSADPIVLVQDYHLALVPRMIREQLPQATIIMFWHIPWPNPEAFAICPWREQLLDGLLGSSILGFHTQVHCNNFVDTVDRQLEARVDRDAFVVSYGGARTMVRRYPISVQWPPAAELMERPIADCRARIRSAHGLPPEHRVCMGVDRLDYTKGIEERFRAVERMFELHPEWVGRFTHVQIAAPTRSTIEQYRGYELRVRALAARINARYSQGGPPPIVLLVQHHSAAEVHMAYRGADVCFVSSLHDGMNLVAKEFVASRDDDDGVLVLSQFAGAARELPEALIVNPYDADECAAALHTALTMPLRARRARMQLMRGLLQEFNVYRWAGRMLLDAARRRRRDRFSGQALVRHTRATDHPASNRASRRAAVA